MLIDTLPDAGNLALAGLVFSQLFGSQKFSIFVAMAGLAAWQPLHRCRVISATVP